MLTIGTRARWGPAAAFRRFGRDRRAAIALMAALAAPVLLMSVAMGIEVAHWSAVQIETQRITDVAALAGAESYGAGATAQQAANASANVAELNGAAGTANRTWSAGSQTLSDNQITVTVYTPTGVQNPVNPVDPAVRATVVQPVPLLFSGIVVGTGSVPIHAMALAEVGTVVSGPQPCVLTLNGDANGVVTLPGITVSGNTDASMTGCSLVSDGKISMSGNLTLDVSSLYSAGTISMSGNVSGTGTNSADWHQSSPPVADPYAGDSTLQNAIAQADCAPTQAQPAAVNGTITLVPNVCYGPISISGNTNVAFDGTGLYTVNGSITISGNTTTTISGSGITVASTGAISISGNFNTGAVALTAPTVGTASNGAISGVLFATDSTGANTVSGNAAIPFTGLIYAPNGSISLSGNATDGSTGCSEIITQSLTISGNLDLSANCSNYGLANFGSLPNTSSIGLVQ